MKKTVTVYYDSLSGEEISADDHHKVMLGIDNKRWALDLTSESKTQLMNFIEPFISNEPEYVPEPETQSTARRSSAPQLQPGERERLQEWAAGYGIQVAERGRVRASLVKAFRANAEPDAKDMPKPSQD